MPYHPGTTSNAISNLPHRNHSCPLSLTKDLQSHTLENPTTPQHVSGGETGLESGLSSLLQRGNLLLHLLHGKLHQGYPFRNHWERTREPSPWASDSPGEGLLNHLGNGLGVLPRVLGKCADQKNEGGVEDQQRRESDTLDPRRTAPLPSENKKGVPGYYTYSMSRPTVGQCIQDQSQLEEEVLHQGFVHFGGGSLESPETGGNEGYRSPLALRGVGPELEEGDHLGQ